MTHEITLQQIRNERPCAEGWSTLLTALGYGDGKFDPERRVTLGDIALSNGAQDAVWCVRCLPASARPDLMRAITPTVERAKAAADWAADWAAADWAARAADWAARAAGAAAAEAADWSAARAADWSAAARAGALEERRRQVDDIVAVFGVTSTKG